jgi:hypothetical protein
MKTIFALGLFAAFFLFPVEGNYSERIDFIFEQRGCCSWHGGVCGCDGGRKVCCDGTYSPSCTC